MTLEYQKQTIELACADDRVVTIEAMVGVGTGLAYHPVVSKPELYTLTHVPTGYAITELTMPTELEIQAFLEKVADLDPNRWQIGLVALKHRYNTNMRMQIELAHYDACSPYTVFMYPDGDEPESFDAVEDPRASSNLALAVEIFFYRQYTKPVECVKLVRMHRGTGQHETLHVYARNEVLPPSPFAFIKHLITLALVHLGSEYLKYVPGEGEFELEVDGWLATIELCGKRVCLWDFDQDGSWEVYNVMDLSAASGELVEEDEEVRMERMRIHWAEQPHTNTFGDYGLPQVLPEGFIYQRPVCEMSQEEAASLHSGGVEA